MPSIVSALPRARTLMCVPADITARTCVEVASPKRSLRFSWTVIVLPAAGAGFRTEDSAADFPPSS